MRAQALDATFAGAVVTEKKLLREEYGPVPPGKQMSWVAKAKSCAPPPKRQTAPPNEAVNQLNELMRSVLQTKAAPPLPPKPPLPRPLRPPPPWRLTAEEALAKANIDMEELVEKFNKIHGFT